MANALANPRQGDYSGPALRAENRKDNLWHRLKSMACASIWIPVKAGQSEAIHSCVVDALQFPQDRRTHRFFPLEAADFYFPGSATPRYTIIEISMFENRSVDVRKRLIRLLFERICASLGRQPNELEITITETPRHNWGFRGLPGDEIALPYRLTI